MRGNNEPNFQKNFSDMMTESVTIDTLAEKALPPLRFLVHNMSVPEPEAKAILNYHEMAVGSSSDGFIPRYSQMVFTGCVREALRRGYTIDLAVGQ